MNPGQHIGQSPRRRTDSLEIIQNGENSGIEFKRDIRPEQLAKKRSSLSPICAAA
jgi:hypothetical protein